MKNQNETGEPVDSWTALVKVVRERLGEERLGKLAAQPACLACGGLEAVLRMACTECAGFPQPFISAAVRVLQLCGSQASSADLEEGGAVIGHESSVIGEEN